MGLGSGISRSLSLVGVLVIVLSVRLGLDRGRRRLVRAGGVIGIGARDDAGCIRVEALRRIDVVDFPVFVGVDVRGRDVYDLV